jgi:hypothetical protein
MIRAVRDRLPFPFFGAIGTFLVLTGAAAEMTVLTHFIRTGQTSPYHSFITLGAIFLILGAVSFLVALLADMLSRMRETQETLLYLEKRRYYDELVGGRLGSNGEPQASARSHRPVIEQERSPVVSLRRG